MEDKKGYLGALLKEEKAFEEVDYVYKSIEEAMVKVRELNNNYRPLYRKQYYTEDQMTFINNGSDSIYWLFRGMVDSFMDYGFFKDDDFTKLLDVVVKNINIYNLDDDENTEEGVSDFDDNQ